MLYHVLNALSNKSVFILDLKTENEEAILIEVGKSFHSLGPNTEKARSPLDFSFDLGIDRSLWFDDRSDLDRWCSVNRADKYGGARLFKDLYTNIKSLYSTL